LYFVLCLLATLRNTNAAIDYTTTHTGKLTFYGAGADSGGTCMYNNPQFNLGLPTVAIGNFGTAEKCGACVYITPLGTGSGNSDFPTRKPFVAFVNNRCSECLEDNLDLAESSDGVWDIRWKFVDCPTTSNIQLQLKTGSSIWHTEISARNFRQAIKSIEYKINNQWTTLVRQDYNYFLYGSQITIPVDVRLTSLTGSQQTYTINDYSALEPNLITTTVQFPSSGSTATPPSTTPPPPPSTPKPTPSSTPKPTPSSTPKPTPSSTPKPTPSTTSCSLGTGTNDYWVEIITGVNGGQDVSVVCSDGRAFMCPYQYDKYCCQISGSACKAVSRKAYINGVCCSVDAGSCTTSAVEEDSTMGASQGKVTLTPGILVGILLGAVAITALVVGVIAYKLLKRPVNSYV